MTSENKKAYDPKKIEKFWQDFWEDTKAFSTKRLSKDENNYYVLEMFPYPSGRIHMGHVRVYTLGDVLARYKRAKGFNVLHPMGWDAFGMPAENAAFENNIHPKIWTEKNIKNMKSQLKSMGLSYDWKREISTCSKEYIEQQQKLFITLFNSNLAYKKESWANWDPVEKSVLANEQVIEGKGWRSGAKVEKKLLSQWFLAITNFAKDLLEDLDELSAWPENVKIMQKNWIGQSKGLQLKFSIFKNDLILDSDENKIIEIFTTRPDTIFGATFIAIAPDHKLSSKLMHKKYIKQFVSEWEKTFSDEETIEKGEKKGVFTELFALHPLSGKKLPIYIANFVLSTYGTGAIFGVPAHDQRDYEFAKKYQIDIIPVIKPIEGEIKDSGKAYTGDGTLINSDFLNGLDVNQAKNKIIETFEQKGIGKKKVKYRIRDWCASRQRYWGCPIPIIYREDGEILTVNEEDLPIELPLDVDFSKKGNPLDNHPTWKYTVCKKTGLKAIRETDTLDTFFDSAWYYYRFVNNTAEAPFDSSDIDKWCPVHQYVGGIEHAVLHLLYARFFTKALKKTKKLNINEPFKGLFCQGMVCHKTYQDENKNWIFPEQVKFGQKGLLNKKTGLPVKELRSEKMSKSKKNIVDPVDIIKQYGADTARIFMLSDSPPERNLEWSDSGIRAAYRYIQKIWNFFSENNLTDIDNKKNIDLKEEQAKKLRNMTHFYINKISICLEKFQYNVAVAGLRELSNIFTSITKPYSKEMLFCMKETLSVWTIMAAPMMPHLAEELWKLLGNEKTNVHQQDWPVANTKYLEKEKINLVIQINGKKKLVLNITKGLTKKEIEKTVLQTQEIINNLENKSIKKIIIIPNRVCNLVV